MVRSILGTASLVALVSLAASACGDSGGSGGPPAASQLYESWSSTFCDVLTSCPVADEDLSFFKLLASADEAACRSFVGRLFDQRRPEENLETIIAQGRVTYHGDQLSGCLSAARSACSVELDEVAACAGVFEGMVATDGACWVHEECAGDAFCEQSDSDCVGVCKPRPKRGEACWYGDCSQTEGPSDCGGAGTCVPRVTVEGGAVGSPCGTEWGDAEVTERRCAAGLACDYDFDADASECVALGAEGQACGGDADPHCGAGLACATPPGGASTCKKVAIATNVGASCNETDPSQPLVGCNIFKRLVCDGGTCEALGDGSLGSACAPNVDLDGICDYGTHCDGERAVCAAPKADGERCESGSECASGVCSFTSGDSGTCHPLSCD